MSLLYKGKSWGYTFLDLPEASQTERGLPWPVMASPGLLSPALPDCKLPMVGRARPVEAHCCEWDVERQCVKVLRVQSACL